MAYNLLKGKKGIIFGALDEHSIAWKVAEQAHAEGAEFILSNAPIAMRMGAINNLAEKTNSEIIPADATSVEDLEKLVQAAKDKFGGLDFILHSIGMSPNIRKKIPYENLNYKFYMQSVDVSALSFHKVMHVANKLDAINDYASILALSYVAAQRSFPDYTDMAQAKAMLESIARSFGAVLAKSKKARVNTISQSPTMTTAGKGIEGFQEFFKFAQDMSPLGNASAQDCASYAITLFSDLTRSVTMQNLMHDGGFSASGITADIIEQIKVD